jgi:hypothetical protein
MIASQVKYILNPSVNGYRPSKKKEITPKNNYMKSAQRTILFKQES